MMFSARTPDQRANASKSIHHTENGASPLECRVSLRAQSTRMCGPHVERDCAFHASVCLERSSKRDGQHVLSVDGDVARNPVKMNYRGTRTKLQKHIVGICSALRDVGVHTHVCVKCSVNGAMDLLSVGVLKVMALANHSLANACT